MVFIHKKLVEALTEQQASMANTDGAQSPKLVLLEFDDRFAFLKEFIRYDFHAPLKLPRKIIRPKEVRFCSP